MMDIPQSFLKVIKVVPQAEGVLRHLTSTALEQRSEVSRDFGEAISGYGGLAFRAVVAPGLGRSPTDRKRVHAQFHYPSGDSVSYEEPVQCVAHDVSTNYYDWRVLEAWMNEIFYESFLNDELGSCQFDHVILNRTDYNDPDYDPADAPPEYLSIVRGPIFLKDVLKKLLRWNRKPMRKLTVASVPESLYEDMDHVTSEWIPLVRARGIGFDALQELEFSKDSSIRDSRIFAIRSLSPNLKTLKVHD